MIQRCGQEQSDWPRLCLREAVDLSTDEPAAIVQVHQTIQNYAIRAPHVEIGSTVQAKYEGRHGWYVVELQVLVL